MNEIIFLEAQITILIQAIRVTKDVDSIQALRAITREAIERMEQRKREEALKRLNEGGLRSGLPVLHLHRLLSHNFRKSSTVAGANPPPESSQSFQSWTTDGKNFFWNL